MQFLFIGRSFCTITDCKIIKANLKSVVIIRSDNNQSETLSTRNNGNKFLILDDGFFPKTPNEVQRKYLNDNDIILNIKLSQKGIDYDLYKSTK